MKAYLITVANNGHKEVDQIIYDAIDDHDETIRILRREVRDLREMDCGTIDVIEAIDGKQAEDIEDWIKLHGKFGRLAIKLFDGAKFW